MKAEIKNLIIDLGVVLVDLTPEKCFEAFRQLGVKEPMEHWATPTQGRGVFARLEEGITTLTEFRNELRQLTQVEMSDSAIDEAWNAFLGTIPASKLELLLSLKHNYRLFLLSNTNELHWRKVCVNDFIYQGYEVNDFFEKTYLSHEMGLAKPNLAIFQEVLQDAGIEANETFLIDDSVANCEAATTLGITTYSPVAGEDWSHLFTEE